VFTLYILCDGHNKHKDSKEYETYEDEEHFYVRIEETYK